MKDSILQIFHTSELIEFDRGSDYSSIGPKDGPHQDMRLLSSPVNRSIALSNSRISLVSFDTCTEEVPTWLWKALNDGFDKHCTGVRCIGTEQDSGTEDRVLLQNFAIAEKFQSISERLTLRYGLTEKAIVILGYAKRGIYTLPDPFFATTLILEIYPQERGYCVSGELSIETLSRLNTKVFETVFDQNLEKHLFQVVEKVLDKTREYFLPLNRLLNSNRT